MCCISHLPSWLRSVFSRFGPFSLNSFVWSYEVCWLVHPLTPIMEVMSWSGHVSCQGIDDYSVMLTRAIASVVFFSFLSFCLSRLLALSFCGVSQFIRCSKGNHFFFFPFCIFWRHSLLTPSVTLFSALCTGKPRYLYPPSALELAVSCLPSCSCSNKPLSHTETMSTWDLSLLKSYCVIRLQQSTLLMTSTKTTASITARLPKVWDNEAVL